MKFILDTANIDQIRTCNEIFPISGVTSNPSIVKKEGRIDFLAHMNTIRSIIGPEKCLHVQVSARDQAGMLKDADAILSKIDRDVYVKVPVCLEGIAVIKALKAKGVRVTATGVMSSQQGLLALEAGADYIAPYYNRMESMGIDACGVIGTMAEMIDRYQYPTVIVAASFRNAEQVMRAFLAGAQSVTLDPSILYAMVGHTFIPPVLDAFEADWKSIYGDKTIADL